MDVREKVIDLKPCPFCGRRLVPLKEERKTAMLHPQKDAKK